MIHDRADINSGFTIQASRNATRYPSDLQPWGAHASGITVTADGTVLVNWYGGTCRGVDQFEAFLVCLREPCLVAFPDEL